MSLALPPDFVTLMRDHLGDPQAEVLFEGLAQEPVVSVRLNPRKTAARLAAAPVPWCAEAYYFDERPPFTFDPLLHAGAYYVQEASSMYLDEVLRRHLPEGALVALDLCAAPGGKSTLLRSRLADDCLLVSNEPVRARSQVLAENLTKWGHPACVVTQNLPEDFTHLADTFDLLVADVPCSGEGMFRKDEEALREWSLENVDLCWHRQRDILQTIWPTLKAGGLLVYSTCTFNRLEDEDNAHWIASTLGADLLEERHFLPGRDRGEGFYIAALRKRGTRVSFPEPPLPKPTPIASLLGDFCLLKTPAEHWALPLRHAALMQKLRRTMRVLVNGVQVAELKGRDWLPAHALALSSSYVRGTYPEAELSYAEAIAYLRREALRIDAPRGILLLTFQGLPLGFAKSVGSRANNLYPQEWRIRTTYTPAEPFTLWR